MTILTMPRCPGAGRGGAGGAAVLLLDVLHPQNTHGVQGGVLRSAMAMAIYYTRFYRYYTDIGVGAVVIGR